MAWDGFKMTVFEQFRHALTRHDPKTYLPWLVELILLKLKECLVELICLSSKSNTGTAGS